VEREILHVNTDDFYASVLRLRDPALRKHAVVVVGASPRGMVFSASYEAREDGVTRGMTASVARRLSSRATFLSPDWGLFRRASSAIFGVLRRYSPVVESASLDEGYVDYSGCGRLFGPALDAGRRIKDEIARETGLAVSLGVASNKLVSHVASRSAKCANLVDVYAGYERSFVAPVPVERFPLVGEKRSPALCELGVARVGDVLLFPEEIFAFCFGSWGKRLYRGALGEDTAPVRTRAGIDERFTVEEILEPDRVEYRFLEGVLYRLAERLGEKLRAERSLAGVVGLEVRYADGLAAKGTERPGTRAAGGANGGSGGVEARDVPAASEATASAVSDDLSIYEAAREIFARVYARRVRVRSLVLSAGRIVPAPLQLELFAGDREAAVERRGKLYAALDRLRAAYPGRAAPAFGRALAARVLPPITPRVLARYAGPAADCTPPVLASKARCAAGGGPISVTRYSGY
jgi:DNA polymerase-4